ncbi:MAG: tRNA modification GTPase [Acidobacteriota bacterium]
MLPARLPETEDTIVAVATPPGRAALGMVRLAGRRARRLAVRLFRPFHPDPAFPQPLQAAAGTALREPGGAPLDRGVLVFFPAAASPVGEDLVEVTLHGSPVVLSLYLEACTAQGARPALPGEFSYRAFLHDRLDAAQAEAVDDLVKARTEHQVRVAHRQLCGALGKAVEPVRRLLVDELARQEASIEFSSTEEEDFLPVRQFEASLQQARASMLPLLQSAGAGLALAQGCRVVLAGRVNAGKSSLFNRLLGAERAIVHSGPGTTRDLVEGQVEWEGLPLTLVDTAGLRREDVQPPDAGVLSRDPGRDGAASPAAPRDPVEAEGLRRGRQARLEADLVLWVRDVTQPSWEEPPGGPVPFLVVDNKIDLSPQCETARPTPGQTGLPVSARTGEGLKRLKNRIIQHLVPGWNRDEPPFVSRLRQKRCLEEVLAALDEAAGLARQDAGEEIVVLALKRALEHLSRLTGRGGREEIYDRIFSSFCIGK